MAFFVSSAVFAGVFGDTSDAKHAWAVHDANRPLPAKVTPGATPGAAPSDAIVLFDGTEQSFKDNWCDSKGEATKWKFVDGTIESVRGGGYLFSRQKFADIQLHVEWQPPVKIEGSGQGRGNSGVFVINDSYEVQVLDSYETDPKNLKNPNYADGMAGAVYGQNPTMVNPSKPTPEWQTYDIIFHPAVWEGNTCVHPPTFTVFFNGVLVQDDWQIEGPTGWRGRPRQNRRPDKGSIVFQDHGNPVHFRNVWVREIPSRYANTTHGTYLAKEADVAALREKLASELFAKVDLAKKGGDGVLKQLFEVVSYNKDAKYMAALEEAAQAYTATVKARQGEAIAKAKNEVNSVWEQLERLRYNKVLDIEWHLRKFLDQYRKDNGYDKR